MKSSSRSYDDAEVLDEFERRLRAFVEEHSRGSPLQPQFAHHFGYAGQSAAKPGKRLRPRLTLAANASFGGPPLRALDACVAIELLHNYSLIHDDIEDGDRLRRGRQTLWAAFGEAQGINAGDAVGALAYLALTPLHAELGAASVFAMLQDLAVANVAMCEGQARDLAMEGGGDSGLAAYMQMIEGKTGALFRCATALGARCALAGEADVERCAKVGLVFGLGFQIQDDVIGIWGEQETTGKLAYADLARRKKSYPVVWAMERDPEGAGKQIAAVYAMPDSAMTDAVLAGAKRTLDRVGARAAALACADRLFQQALEQARGLAPLSAFVSKWREARR